MAGLRKVAGILNQLRRDLDPRRVNKDSEVIHMNIHISNQTRKAIDLCAGHTQELTIQPGIIVIVNLESDDVIYLDLIREPEGDNDGV